MDLDKNIYNRMVECFKGCDLLFPVVKRPFKSIEEHPGGFVHINLLTGKPWKRVRFWLLQKGKLKLAKYRKKRKYYNLTLPKNIKEGDVVVYMKEEFKVSNIRDRGRCYLMNLDNIGNEDDEMINCIIWKDCVFDVVVSY